MSLLDPAIEFSAPILRFPEQVLIDSTEAHMALFDAFSSLYLQSHRGTVVEAAVWERGWKRTE